MPIVTEPDGGPVLKFHFNIPCPRTNRCGFQILKFEVTSHCTCMVKREFFKFLFKYLNKHK